LKDDFNKRLSRAKSPAKKNPKTEYRTSKQLQMTKIRKIQSKLASDFWF